jgi:hypothetical protein
MQHVLPEIMTRINRFFGYEAVSKVKIRQGYIAKPTPQNRPVSAPMLKPIPIELGDSLREIADPELFAVLNSLAQSLANNISEQDKLAKSDK